MGIFTNAINRIADRLADRLYTEAGRTVATSRAYRLGQQPEQLDYQSGQYNDNITLNFTGLIANRIVSQMFGQGVTFDFEGESETEQERYINACLDANHQEVLFHRACLSDIESGTGYLFLMPGGAFGPDGAEYPRLQLVDPAFMTMETLPEDFEIVVRYTIQYKITDASGKERAKKRVIEQDEPGGAWMIRDYISASEYASQWTLTQELPFTNASGDIMPFPPILHWQGLPSIDKAQGEPVINPTLRALQDRVNFLSSNVSKIIRYYAHPLRWGKGLDQLKMMDMGPSRMVSVPDTGEINQLDPLGDLAGSQNFIRQLRQTMFDTARVVDIDSVQDKLGQLTNFGLRVLYQDNVAMVGTKRELFGDMLEELLHRIQIMNNMQPVPCEVVWPDFLPQNEIELVQAYTFDLTNGLASKRTIATKRGYDWEQEQQRIDEESQYEQSNVPDQWYEQPAAQTEGQADQTNGSGTDRGGEDNAR